MSDELKAKHDELYEKHKNAETDALLKLKMSLVKDLQKNVEGATNNLDIDKSINLLKELDRVLKQLSQIDVTKASERSKVNKLLEKVSSLLSSMQIINQLVSEKDKIIKSLEKVAEVAAAIPVIEKILKDKDF
jgi:carbon monoxide dehydrogenase subunit G